MDREAERGKVRGAVPRMADEVVALLRCPHCAGDLEQTGGSIRCGAGHAFDVARQGYVSLLPGNAQTGTADTAAMVEAREAFLGSSHYGPLAARVAEHAVRAAAREPAGCVVDLGAGTGYYLARVLDQLPDRNGLALDLSKYAARRAARAHDRIGALVCDTWEPLPIRDEVAAVVLDVFAPRSGAEMRRILAPDGALIVVTPTRRHLGDLAPLIDLLGIEERKVQRLAEQLGPFVDLADREHCEWPLALSHDDVEALVAMGPTAHHLVLDEVAERVRALPEPVVATASVTVSVYRRPEVRSSREGRQG